MSGFLQDVGCGREGAEGEEFFLARDAGVAFFGGETGPEGFFGGGEGEEGLGGEEEGEVGGLEGVRAGWGGRGG